MLTAQKLKYLGVALAALATVLTAAAGLYTAVGAAHEPKASASYDALREAIETIQDGQRKDHEDLLALRAYLEGLTRSQALASTRSGAGFGLGSGRRRAPTLLEDAASKPPPLPPAPVQPEEIDLPQDVSDLMEQKAIKE